MTGPTVDIDTGRNEQRFATITDDALASLRRLIGVPIADTVEPWCYEATRDNIRHYAHGIGDDNPLWCDPSYAAATSYGTVIAPPSFVFALDRILSGYVGGLPGIHAMWAGADLTWHRPILRGTEVRTEAHLKDLVEHQTRFAGRAIQQIYHVDLFDAAGDLLCGGDSWCFRTERDTAREMGTKYDAAKNRPPMRYSGEDLERIFAIYEAERVRGAEPRYVEDVTVGEELPPMAKGPMTVTGFIAFAQGWGGLYIRANKLAFQQLRKHPGLGIPNAFGIPDVPERVHWENDLATDVGTPAAYDYGPERCSWLTQHVTNWMGDDGFLRRHRCQIRHHNIVGDWLTITGRVTAKRTDDDGHPVVDVEQEARNQHGELSARGAASIRLPSRGRVTAERTTGRSLSKDGGVTTRTWIDHLVFAAPALDDGIAAVQAAIGVTPVPGGAHPGRGTHNALLSLGPPTYLEVIAPDPAQVSSAPAPFGLDTLGGSPRLVAFAVGCADIDATVAALRASGRADVGSPFAMSRRRPDGSELSWRLAMIGEGPAGATPFLISWDSGGSPADDSPPAGRLVALRAGHPEPRAVAELLAALGVDVSVEASPTEWLEATIESGTRLVTLT